MRLLDFRSVRIIDNNGSAICEGFDRMANIARHHGDNARLHDLGHALDCHFEFTLDDLVDFFLRMEVLVYGRAALEIVVRKRYVFRVEIPSVPPRQTLNDIEAVGINKGHRTSPVSDFTSD